jgi:hypothetical protein
MIYNNITNEEVISLYENYQLIKQLILEIEYLKNYLTANKIIKQSYKYIVINGCNFDHNSYKEYRNVLFKYFISTYQVNLLNRIYSLTYKFDFSLGDNSLVYNTNINYSEQNINEIVKTIFAFFKLEKLYEIKKKLKVMIVNKINNTEIRTI